VAGIVYLQLLEKTQFESKPAIHSSTRSGHRGVRAVLATDSTWDAWRLAFVDGSATVRQTLLLLPKRKSGDFRIPASNHS
jgi:hypothetical protein